MEWKVDVGGRTHPSSVGNNTTTGIHPVASLGTTKLTKRYLLESLRKWSCEKLYFLSSDKSYLLDFIVNKIVLKLNSL